MIPRNNTVFTALLLAFTILISSVGVAQVSHICRLALAGIEKQSCESENEGEHACCDIPQKTVADEKEKESCCSNEIKIFRQTVDSLTPTFSKFLPVDVAVISLFCSPVLFGISRPAKQFYSDRDFTPIATGISLVIINRAILI